MQSPLPTLNLLPLGKPEPIAPARRAADSSHIHQRRPARESFRSALADAAQRERRTSEKNAHHETRTAKAADGSTRTRDRADHRAIVDDVDEREHFDREGTVEDSSNALTESHENDLQARDTQTPGPDRNADDTSPDTARNVPSDAQESSANAAGADAQRAANAGEDTAAQSTVDRNAGQSRETSVRGTSAPQIAIDGTTVDSQAHAAARERSITADGAPASHRSEQSPIGATSPHATSTTAQPTGADGEATAQLLANNESLTGAESNAPPAHTRVPGTQVDSAAQQAVQPDLPEAALQDILDRIDSRSRTQRNGEPSHSQDASSQRATAAEADARAPRTATQPAAEPVARSIQEPNVPRPSVARAHHGERAQHVNSGEVPSTPQAPAVARSAEINAQVRQANITGTPSPVTPSTLAAQVGSSTLNAKPGAGPGTSPVLTTAAAPLQTLLNLDGQATAFNGTDAASGHTPADHSAEAAGARQIMRGLLTMLNQRGGAMTMRLDPPELGQLRIQMHLSAGVVQVEMTAGDASARALLERNLSTLRSALEGQGLTVERMAVHGGTAGAGGAHTGPQDGGDGAVGQHRSHADAGNGESRGRRDGASHGDARGGGDGHDYASDARAFERTQADEPSQDGWFMSTSTHGGAGGRRSMQHANGTAR